MLLSGYTRRVVVRDSEFSLLGGSAVALWGRASDGYDITGGQQPRFTVVERCFFHDLGLIQKQSSALMQAVAPQNVFRNCIAFNLPRAAVNQNDGAGGGSEVAWSLLFNTCRESGDHGAYNAWDRLPYLSELFNGSPSVKQAQNLLHHNVIISNYNAYAGCFDHDDGASFADIFNNFCVGGGHKNNYDGHSKHATHNVYAWPSIYGPRCFGFFSTFMETIFGAPEIFADNVCIQDSMQHPQSGYEALWILETVGPQQHCPRAGDADFWGLKNLSQMIALANNTVYVPAGGNLSIGCGQLPPAFNDYAAMGWDQGGSKVVKGLPTSAEIIDMARALVEVVEEEA